MKRIFGAIAVALTLTSMFAPAASAAGMVSYLYVVAGNPNSTYAETIKDSATGAEIQKRPTGIIADRRPTGQNATLPFGTNEQVHGTTITVQGFGTATPSGCLLPTAPGPGNVTNGVINPWSTELPGLQYCTGWSNQAAPATGPPATPAFGTINGQQERFTSATGGQTNFGPGEAPFGNNICLSNGVCSKPRFMGGLGRGAFMRSAPMAGTVFDGGVNPTQDEINRDQLQEWGGQ